MPQVVRAPGHDGELAFTLRVPLGVVAAIDTPPGGPSERKQSCKAKRSERRQEHGFASKHLASLSI